MLFADGCQKNAAFYWIMQLRLAYLAAKVASRTDHCSCSIAVVIALIFHRSVGGRATPEKERLEVGRVGAGR